MRRNRGNGEERERERSMEGLTDEERRALRGSKFAHLPLASSSSRSKPKPRLPHPGGPLTTNKATALVKFLERKLQEPNGLVSIKPKLVERAVKNAKDIVNARRIVRHVDSFGDYEVVYFCVPVIIFGKASINRYGGEKIESKKHKKKKKKKKKKDKGKKKKKSSKDIADAVVKRPKKKLKL
ncbi:unnamed protein product [Camellia sinensis]